VHPTQPAKDRTLLVRPSADGSFSVPLAEMEQALAPGGRGWQPQLAPARAWVWPQQRSIEMNAEAYAPAE
jgi:hypothetical protein